MKKLKLLVMLLSIIALTNCKKLTKTTWVYYNETYCSDAWGDSNASESSKIDNVKKYLKDKDIKVFSVEVISDGNPEPCMSCGCKSGNRLKCEIKSKDKSKAIALNFYE